MVYSENDFTVCVMIQSLPYFIRYIHLMRKKRTQHPQKHQHKNIGHHLQEKSNVLDKWKYGVLCLTVCFQRLYGSSVLVSGMSTLTQFKKVYFLIWIRCVHYTVESLACLFFFYNLYNKFHCTFWQNKRSEHVCEVCLQSCHGSINTSASPQ